MPGKHAEARWAAMSPLALLREVTAQDADTRAAVEALDEDEELNLLSANTAYDNVVHLGVILPAAGPTQVTVKVYADMSPSQNVVAGVERWCLVHEETITESEVVTLTNVPATKIRVMLTTWTGNGTATIIESHSP